MANVITPDSTAPRLRFCAHVEFRRANRRPLHDARPPREAVRLMLDELSLMLARAGAVPVGLRCEAWAHPSPGAGDHRLVARITISAEPGEAPARPLRSWFEWQHPSWAWRAAPSAIDGETAGGVLILPAAPVAR